MQKLLAGISLSNKWVLPGRFPMWGGSARHFPSDALKNTISFRFKYCPNPLYRGQAVACADFGKVSESEMKHRAISFQTEMHTKLINF